MRKRKSRGTWLPTFGNLTGEEGTQNTVNGVDSSISVAPEGYILTKFHVLTLDDPKESQSDENTLADVVGSEYLLKRIVGKFFAFNFGTDSSVLFGLLTVGFFVARADAENSFYPLGADSNLISTGTGGDEAIKSFSPQEQQAMREPWIWRRSWILGNGGQDRTFANVAGTIAPIAIDHFPSTTVGYGSVADGPHIDAKTLRRVGQDDRLYMAVSTVRWPIGGEADPQTEDSIIAYHLDYRLFGALRRARQTGRF